MDRMVARYQKKDTNERLFNREFESLVIQWLNDLADGKQQIDEEPIVRRSSRYLDVDDADFSATLPILFSQNMLVLVKSIMACEGGFFVGTSYRYINHFYYEYVCRAGSGRYCGGHGH